MRTLSQKKKNLIITYLDETFWYKIIQKDMIIGKLKFSFSNYY